MPDFIFNGWNGVLRILLIAPVAYIALVLILRTAGKRTLSKLNAFDFVVTIAIGSTLASIIVTKSVALVEGLVALALLVAFQFAVTSASVRWPRVNSAVKSEPSLLLCRGEPLTAVMRHQRVTIDELKAAVRQAGGHGLEDAEAVFLETDGSLTALLKAG